MSVKILLFTLILSFSLHAQESTRLLANGHMNKYPDAGYNDCWGYTDEQGREYAFLGVRNGTSIIDITDSSNLKEIAFIPSATSIWKDIKTYKNYAYIVNETGGGLQIIDLSNLPESASLINTYDGFKTSHNLYIDETRGLLFAEGDHMQPVRVLSLEDPINPKQVSSFGVEVHDIFARDNLIYVSEGGHGTISVYDYTDEKNIKLAYRFEIPEAGYVHNAWLSHDSRYLMTTEENTNKTVKVRDIQDPTQVVQVSEYLALNNLAHNTHIKGNYAYISHYGGGLRIVDLSDPTAAKEAAFYMKGDEVGKGFVNVWGAYPFFNSGKILVSDIESGLYIVDFEPAKR